MGRHRKLVAMKKPTWIPVTKAATMLGVSDTAVWKMAQAKRLERGKAYHPETHHATRIVKLADVEALIEARKPKHDVEW